MDLSGGTLGDIPDEGVQAPVHFLGFRVAVVLLPRVLWLAAGSSARPVQAGRWQP